MKTRKATVLSLAFCVMLTILLSGCVQRTAIFIPKGSTELESLAAKEIRRYVYLRTGEMLPIVQDDKELPSTSCLIVVGQKDRSVIKALIDKDSVLKDAVRTLEPQQYQIKTIAYKKQKAVLIIGGDPVGALYGAYRFAEHTGVRFYLHGDTIPDKRIALKLPEINEGGRPLFELRGIHPFHDFPEGPDWWNTDDYKAIIGQLVKLRMNFIGLHTYPEKEPNHQLGNSEPTVWIGLSKDVEEDGQVKFSYPSRHYNTVDSSWGYAKKKTGEYSFGAAWMFDRDDYAADYMKGATPWPETPQECNEVFNRFGTLLREAFTFAHRLGVKTCVGTEVPLTIPKLVTQRIKEPGKDLSDAAMVGEVYEGVFQRIMKAYPIDYYCLWTPEDWIWKDPNDKQLAATLCDIRIAIAAAEKVNSPFTLATAGWVLGPQKDRALFDNVLPKTMPASCINCDVGFAPVESGFARVKDRSKWSMPWLEDDPALTIPQLWAGRMRRDAADSLAYGCTGLMGLQWRTRILSPNVAALAYAAWDQSGWNKDFGKKVEAPEPNLSEGAVRDLPIEDFYADWALVQFGQEAAEPMAKLFARLDGGLLSKDIKARKTNLPRPATWVKGPGGIKVDETPWGQASKKYAFVDEMAKLRRQVKGAGNLERFDYWLNNFRYLRAVGQVSCTWGRFSKEMEKVKAENEAATRNQLAREALAIHKELASQVAEVHQYLLTVVTTTGEMGTVANWQQHIIPKLVTEPGLELSEISGESLPADTIFSKEYHGQPRMFVPTVRSNLADGEDLKLKVIIMAKKQPEDAAIYWRPIGEKKYERRPLIHVARGVYSVEIPAEQIKQADIEYYIKVNIDKNAELYFPVTAPKINQTVVIMGLSK